MSCPNSSDDTCGCAKIISSECIVYKGATTNCLPIVRGTDLETILQDIDAALCELTPSGYTRSVVASCSNDIVVTKQTDGVTDNYTVCFHPENVTEIVANSASIAELFTCLNNTVKDITSNSLSVSVDSENDCGRTIRVEYTPSAQITYDGIVYNDATAVGTNGGGGVQILKSVNRNYTSLNDITDGDEIRIQSTGQIQALAGLVDGLKVELYNTTTATVLGFLSYYDFNTTEISSWKFDGVLSVIDASAGTGLFTTVLTINNIDAENQSNVTSTWMKVDDDISAIDYANLSVRVIYDNASSNVATENYVRKLMIDVRKKI